MSREKHRVIVIDHEETGEAVYVWAPTDRELSEALETVNSCVSRGEMIHVSTIRMTEKQYDRLPEYNGEC